jgi:hypothetical protein
MLTSGQLDDRVLYREMVQGVLHSIRDSLHDARLMPVICCKLCGERLVPAMCCSLFCVVYDGLTLVSQTPPSHVIQELLLGVVHLICIQQVHVNVMVTSQSDDRVFSGCEAGVSRLTQQALLQAATLRCMQLAAGWVAGDVMYAVLVCMCWAWHG